MTIRKRTALDERRSKDARERARRRPEGVRGALADPEPLVREHAAWAFERLRSRVSH
jgi:hypothetical protein